MSYEDKTILHSISFDRFGNVQVKFALLNVLDGVEVGMIPLADTIPVGRNFDEVIAGHNTNLEKQGRMPISSECAEKVRAIVAIAHTDDLIFTYQEKLAQEEAARLEQLAQDEKALKDAEIAEALQKETEAEKFKAAVAEAVAALSITKEAK